MKNLMLSLTILLTSYSTFANCDKLNGDWGMQTEINSVTYNTTLSITEESVTLTNICEKAGKKLTAQTTAAASYTDFALTILEDKKDQKSDGDLHCEAVLGKEVMGYNMVFNLLMLNTKGTQLFLFKK